MSQTEDSYGTNPGAEPRAPLQRSQTGLRRLSPPHYLRWLMAAGLLLPLAFWAARLPYRNLKAEEGRKLAADVQRDLGTVSMEEVATKVKLMLSLAPREPEVQRAAARYCASNQMPEALSYQRMLWDREPYDPAEHLHYVQLAIDLGRFRIAATELETLLRRDPNSLPVARQALRLAVVRQHWPLTIQLAEHLLRLRPDDGEATLRLGQALASAGLPSLWPRARSVLLGLVVRPGEWRIDAWRTLAAARSRLAPGEAVLLADLLKQFPSPALDLQLEALDLRAWQASPEARADLRDQAVALIGKEEAGETLAKVAGWLLRHEGADRVLALLPLASVRGKGDLIRLHLAALLQLGRYDEALRVVDEPDSALPKHLALAARTLVVTRGLSRLEAEQHFRAIIGTAKNDARILVDFAELAESEGYHEAALAAWEPLLEIPRLLPTVAGRMLGLAEKTPLVQSRLAPLERLHRLFPDDRTALLELAYAVTVLGEPEPGLLGELTATTNRVPELLAEATLALADAKGGRPEAALARLDRLDMDWDRAAARLQMVRAFALGKAGSFGEAGRLAVKARNSGLRLEEIRLLEPWLPLEKADAGQ